MYIPPEETVITRAEQSIDVDCVALDDLDFPRRVALIKLDIEGAELLALRGATGLLGRDRPALLCELDHAQLARVSGATPEAVMSSLAALGYDAREVGPDGEPGAPLVSAPTARVSTVLFLSRH